MPDVTWTHPFLNKLLDLVPKDSRTILDVGCGRGIVGALCKIYLDSKVIWGIDIFDDYLAFCKEHMPYDNLMKFDLRQGLPNLNMVFDTGICLEVIEHLEKSEGQRLLIEMPKVCRKVIVSTPSEFYRQEPYDRNPHQRHLSLWSAKDFEEMGYTAISGKVPGIRVLGRSIKLISSGLAKFLSDSPRDEWLIAYKESRI